jgi:hypothetical protein
VHPIEVENAFVAVGWRRRARRPGHAPPAAAAIVLEEGTLRERVVAELEARRAGPVQRPRLVALSRLPVTAGGKPTTSCSRRGSRSFIPIA